MLLPPGEEFSLGRWQMAPIVTFCITHSPLCFAGSLDPAPATYLFTLLAKRIFPPGDDEIARWLHHVS
jgi:hypothetical protein